MKKITYIVFCYLLVVNFGQAQQLPDFVQQRLDSIKKETDKSLIEYRVWDRNVNGGITIIFGVGFLFSDEEIVLIDSLKLNLSVGMVYGDEMRNRIVQLLRNEYQDWELDSLVNRRIKGDYTAISYEEDAMNICRFDTLPIFKQALDSFFIALKQKSITDSIMYERYTVNESFYKKENLYNVFKLLQLDTTTIFKKAYNKTVERERKRIREELLNNKGYDRDYIYIAKLCGYIGDKRFIQPLIDMLNMVEDYQKEVIVETLARMRVEPYYSDYVKKRTLTIEQIQNENRLDFSIDDFVYVLGTQEAFLELSKYLLSDKPYIFEDVDYVDHSETTIIPVSQDAFYLIRYNIENKEVQEMIGKGFIKDYTSLLKPLYNWMQKNYGKYKIKRIW